MEFQHSCKTAAETLEWIKAITDFLNLYKFLLQLNVSDFLKDRLWEAALDKNWIHCLETEPVEHLLLIPSGVVQEHWPSSLKEFVLTARLLAYPREQVDLQTVLLGMSITPLNNVLSQGMNPKKKHEVEILSSLVSCMMRNVGAHTMVDVGAGQGYLTQVIAFQYQLPVVAIDASFHHGTITNTRAERIKKYYMAKLRKSGLEKGLPIMPKTITSRILSSDMLKELSTSCCQNDELDDKHLNGNRFDDSREATLDNRDHSLPCSVANTENRSALILAGLHACGDLSVTMLRAIVECKVVKAVVSIGCCYNLLSEDGRENSCSNTGFPASKGVQSMGISLGKSLRDLGCQFCAWGSSAERWRDLGKDACVQNFDLHAYRAAFQMVLHRYYPQALLSKSSIGRQGKALLRQLKKGPMCTSEFAKNERSDGTLEIDSSTVGLADQRGRQVDKYSLFEKFSLSGLCYLGLEPLEDMDLPQVWTDCQPFVGLIGPAWSLRAALGPLLETLIQLDRLLFLQEQESALEVLILPIFDPVLSPRNLAIIAWKNSS